MKKRKPAPKPASATGTKGPKGLPTAKLPALPPGTILKGDQIVDRKIMPVPNYDEAMARQIYQKMMDYQRQNIAAQNAANIQNQFQDYARGVGNLMPVQSQPTMGTMQTIAGPQPFLPTIAGPRPVPGQIPQAQNAANINQAMQTYQNLLNQGAANYQAAMQQPLPAAAQPIQPTRKNISTAKRTPPIQAF